MGKKLKRIGNAILRRKFLWTIILFIVIVGFLDPNSMWHRHELQQQNAALREQIKEQEALYREASRELNALDSDPSAVERVARVNLYMKTADEDVYVIE